MALFSFLCFSVIFSSLVLIVVGSGGRDSRAIAITLIVVEVLLLLQHQGVVDLPFGSKADTRSVLTGIAAIAAFVELLRSTDKTFPLLVVFCCIEQLLVSLRVIDGVFL